jgi:hypothetical protein
LPDGTVENLLKPENKDQLVAVLTYHVVSGKIMSSDIAGKKAQVATVQGSELAVDATSGVMVDNAMVVAADIEASNGVIHVIDTCDRHSGVTELNSVQGIAGGASSRRRGPCLFERGIREPT